MAIGLIEESAQANPVESLPGQSLAQAQKPLADSQLATPDRATAQIEIAAVSPPANSFSPHLQESRAVDQSEDDLIQTMSGQSPAAHVEKVSQPVPVFAPSSTIGLPFPPPQRASENFEPVLVTAIINSDIGLKLVPAQPPLRFSAPSSEVRSLNPDSFQESPDGSS